MGLESEWPGVIGALLIVIGWAFETRKVIREKHSGLPLSFDVLYLTGSLLLTAYAVTIGSLVFAVLNGLATAMAAIGTYFKLTEKAKTLK